MAEEKSYEDVGETCTSCGTYFWDLWCPVCKTISKKPQK